MEENEPSEETCTTILLLIKEPCLEYVMVTYINPGYRTDNSSILLKL